MNIKKINVILFSIILIVSGQLQAAQICNPDITLVSPDSRFTTNGDGTATDNQTDLVWMRCSIGQTWDGSTCTGTATTFNWQAALDEAESTIFAGSSDWRLPNTKELGTIAETACYNPSINETIFPATATDVYYWCSTGNVTHGYRAWSQDFLNAYNGGANKDHLKYARLVRDFVPFAPPPMTTINAAGQSFDKGCGTNNIDVDCQEDEKPEHTITFAHNFEIGTYEVTWNDYQKCIDDGGCTTVPADDGYGKGTRPVTMVSYTMINDEYLPWLNAITGLTYRLPTESEWEYVARDGTSTAYPWGATIGTNNANCKDSDCGDSYNLVTSPVGSFAANSFGVYDMFGNVQEWTQDKYDLADPVCDSNLPLGYTGSPTDGTAYTGTTCVYYVVRDGSYFEKAIYLRSASRQTQGFWKQQSKLGFRLARTL